jgi:hypothetical protein
VLADERDAEYTICMTSTLPENESARVIIESGDTEREEWLGLSEESLLKTWDNSGDDAFNELLSKEAR